MREQKTESNPPNLVPLSKIPAFPPIVIRLLDLLGREDVEIRQLVDLISSDPAFSAQILRVANSALFGFKSRIDSLQSALVVLGLKRVQSLAATVATGNYMKAALQIEELRRCWRHTVACALLTEELARAWGAEEDHAYTAGLLHDIGRLGLLVAYPAEYARMLRAAGRTPLELLDLEKKLFGADHCEAGCLLTARWNLPEPIQVVAGRHHDELAGEPPGLLALVHWSCRLADGLGYYIVPPMGQQNVESILAQMPERLQSHLQRDLGELTGSIAARMQSLDAPAVPEPKPREAAGQESESAGTSVSAGSTEAQPEMFTSLQPGFAADPLRRDLLIVAITGALCTAAFLGLVYFTG